MSELGGGGKGYNHGLLIFFVRHLHGFGLLAAKEKEPMAVWFDAQDEVPGAVGRRVVYSVALTLRFPYSIDVRVVRGAARMDLRHASIIRGRYYL